MAASSGGVYAGTTNGLSVGTCNAVESDATIVSGGSLDVGPTVASDNGTVSYALLSQGTYTGTVSVNPATGVVSLSNAAPVGTHTITIRATDNCGFGNFADGSKVRLSQSTGATTDASFTLTVMAAPVVVSTKLHGAAGPFDIDLPLAGILGIECRSGGTNGNHTIVFNFANALIGVGGASITSHEPANGTGAVNGHSLGADPHQYIVDLTGVSSGQIITVTLDNVRDSAESSGATISVSMGVLVGDTTGSGEVNSSDIGATKLQSGQAAMESNFRNDVNANGVVNASDVSLVKSKSGTALPAD